MAAIKNLTGNNSDKIPKAFLCSSSNQLMNDPVLSLCGHIFEKTIFFKLTNCPIDHEVIHHTECVNLSELKQKIQDYIIKNNFSSDNQNSFFYYDFFKINNNSSKESNENSKKNSSNSKDEIVEKQVIKPYKIIKNAHNDDIHGFILHKNRIISGSKDGSLKFWDINGKLLNIVSSPNNGYKFWITALESFDDGHYAIGTRNGTIVVYYENGQLCFKRNNSLDVDDFSKPICKNRNINRINCIKQLKHPKKHHLFYVGLAKELQLWNLTEKKFIKSFNASDNDWVYCIEPFLNGDLIVVIGSNMQYWKKIDNSYFEKNPIIKETLEEKKSKQRPHISCITRLQNNENYLAASLFSGDVKIVDINNTKVIKTFSEHIGRVWSVCNVNDNNFTSSADDKTIKIWDVRQDSSVMTLNGNPGRVSSLMKLSENTFISGSCPDDIYKSQEKASISFWDIRKV